MKHWTKREIVEWHKKTFPECTLRSQKIKFLEEYREFLESGDVSELADMYIVHSVLTLRFNIGLFSEIFYYEMASFGRSRDLDLEVDKKMDINSNRTWEYVNGVYHHKEDK